MLRCLVLCLCAGTTSSLAQVFTLLDEAPPAVSMAGPRPSHGQIAAIDVGALAQTLAAAPSERLDMALWSYGLRIELPAPDGTMVDCVVAASPIMAPELAAQFGGMKTYVVQRADRLASGRIELTQRGLTGMLRGPEGTWMIDAWQAADPEHVVSYWLGDLPGGGDWTCHTPADPAPVDEAPDYTPRDLQSLRTYRLAFACTGEYGAYHSSLQGRPPNAADPLAAIVTVVSRTNVVYEADLAVRFVLVAGNERLMYLDGATDPYPSTCGGSGGTDCSGSVLGVNAATINGVIGAANYDIGHVVTRIFGGVAYLRSVCTNNKAGGVSGIPRGGDVDPLSALVVIHEIGHQFGANHTFSGTRGRCLGNVSLNTAWEAGAGSSPMAYAGGCPVGDAPPTDNLTQFADPYFHHGSCGEMQAYLAGNGGACAQVTPTGNSIPQITAVTASTAIPPLTAFALDAVAIDADGDSIGYSWEQYANGVARPLSGEGAVDNGGGALFRIFPPIGSPTRVFPRMRDVLAGTATPGERSPTVTGVTRRFRLFVRDFAAGAGGAAVSSFVNIEIAAGTSAFGTTSPTESEWVRPGQYQVRWTVGGTDRPPISLAQVALELSVDDGLTFPHSLGIYSNSGAAWVELPPLESQTARIRLTAPGRIFFAISRPFWLGAPCVGDVNQDGGVDGSDIQAFFELWQTGLPEADLNHDGGVDGGDIETFFIRWEAGC